MVGTLKIAIGSPAEEEGVNTIAWQRFLYVGSSFYTLLGAGEGCPSLLSLGYTPDSMFCVLLFFFFLDIYLFASISKSVEVASPCAARIAPHRTAYHTPFDNHHNNVLCAKSFTQHPPLPPKGRRARWHCSRLTTRPARWCGLPRQITPSNSSRWTQQTLSAS